MDKNLEYLKYLAVKHKEIEFFDTVVRFTEESNYVYPKDVDYCIEEIYVWDKYHNNFQFRITRPDKTQPLIFNDASREYRYTVVYDKELDIIQFNARIVGTDIELTLDEMRQLMLDHHSKFETEA